MTPEQKIKWAIIAKSGLVHVTDEDNIDEAYEEYEDELLDTLYEFREGEV